MELTIDELRSVLADAYERGYDDHRDGNGFFAQASAEALIGREAWK